MSGAAQYLQELPSRGNFSSTLPSSNPGGLRVYICDHDTAPPEEQLIKTDSTNILIRYLNLKKGKTDQKKDNTKRADEGKGKRAAERCLDDKPMSKRVNVGCGAGSSKRENGSCCKPTDRELQSFTVQKLKALLKERGQPLRGNKEELIARLKKSM